MASRQNASQAWYGAVAARPASPAAAGRGPGQPDRHHRRAPGRRDQQPTRQQAAPPRDARTRRPRPADTGAAATATRRSDSQHGQREPRPATIAWAMSSPSHRPITAVPAGALAGPACAAGRVRAGGSSLISTRAPGRRAACLALADDRPAPRRAHVDGPGVTGRPARGLDLGGRAAIVAGPGQQLAHDRDRPGRGLGCQLGLDRPALAGPRHRGAVWPVHLSVGNVLPAARSGRRSAPCSLRSLRQNAPADANCGVAASASRTAVTARRWASLDKPGGLARYGRPHAARPALVSQTQRGPGAEHGRIGQARRPPACRQRARPPLGPAEHGGQLVELDARTSRP